MKALLFLILLSGVIGTLIEHVDPFIGTGGTGFGIGSVSPGPQVPFGMVRLSPDTVGFGNIFIPFNHFGGYYYGDSQIRIFSHTHMVGSGVLDYGNIGVMPISIQPTDSTVTNYGYRSSFSHSKETASPGYYSVLLEDPKVEVELTATHSVGVHRYTFQSHKPNSEDMFVLLDVSHALTPEGCANASFHVTGPQQVSGWILNRGSLSSRFGGVKTYFVAQFSAPFSSTGIWDNNKVHPGKASIVGKNVGGWVAFKTESNEIEVKVGISFISEEEAQRNLRDQSDKTFDQILKETQALWETTLSVVQVEGGQTEDLVKFYTALYHTFTSPTDFTENGCYLGFDSKVHCLTDPSQRYYSDMSLWDVHRTQFPWLAFVRPDVLGDIVKSLLLMYEQGGDIPRWPLANGYTGCMFGQHATIVIADAFFKGIRNFDIQLAYKAMRVGALEPRPHGGRTDIEDWLKIGYIPYEKDARGACLTLAYSFDDWAIGNIAEALNFSSDAQMFHSRSQNYKHVWNSEWQFFCPKSSNGQWECPEIWTNVFDSRYFEGDAWHYRWFVPHDIPGLISLFGKKKYVEQLTELFDRSEYFPFNALPNPWYWAGNEHDILSVWLFDWVGRPDLTQKYSRRILKHSFTTKADGIPGNDDYGTMSAWLVWGYLGIYPLSGSSTYMIGSPVFTSAVVHFPGGKNLTINAVGASPENIYIQKALINGRPLEKPFLQHNQLFNAKVEFVMGKESSQWGQ